MSDQPTLDTTIDFYRRIVERMPLGLTVWELEDVEDPGSFRLVASNPLIEAATGVPFGKLVGQTVREAFPSSLETEGPSVYAEAVRTGHVQELPELRRYGEEVVQGEVFSVTAVPLGGNFVGIFAENITERKRAEEEVAQRSRDLANAMDQLLIGQQQLSAGVASTSARSEPLSIREREVVSLLARGLSNRQIAAAMNVSLPTAKTHVSSILRKLNAPNRTSAVGTARSFRLVE